MLFWLHCLIFYASVEQTFLPSMYYNDFKDFFLSVQANWNQSQYYNVLQFCPQCAINLNANISVQDQYSGNVEFIAEIEVVLIQIDNGNMSHTEILFSDERRNTYKASVSIA